MRLSNGDVICQRLDQQLGWRRLIGLGVDQLSDRVCCRAMAIDAI